MKPTKPKKVKNPVRIAAGKKSKNKGASFERKICNLFDKMGYHAEREVQYRGNTGDAKDIRVEEFKDHHFECKSYASLGKEWWDNKLLKQWIGQCQAESMGRRWFLIFKENAGSIYVLQERNTSHSPEFLELFKLVIRMGEESFVIYKFEELFDKNEEDK